MCGVFECRTVVLYTIRHDQLVRTRFWGALGGGGGGQIDGRS